MRCDRLFERPRAAAGAILDIDLEAAAGADAGHRGRRDHQDEGFAQRLHLAAQIVEDGRGGEACLHPLLERLQGDEDHARIGGVGEGRAVEAGERHRVGDAGPRQQDVGCLSHDAVGALQARARRQRNRGDEVGAVERRDEARRRAGELKIGQPDEAAVDHQHQRRDAQRPPRQSGIARRQPLEQLVEAGEKRH